MWFGWDESLPIRVCKPSTCRTAIGRSALVAAVLMLSSYQAAAETLRQAMTGAYQHNPRLDAERARLRATDEDVPRAISGFRPRVTGSADTGHQKIESNPRTTADGGGNPWGYSLNVSQSVFSGFRTVHSVNEAEALVRAGRENLRNIEQQVLLECLTAYADVVRDQAIVRLRERIVQSLTRVLAAAEERRAVREVTTTDVAQARARRARALSQLDQVRGSMKSSRASFEKACGHAPNSLSPPTPPTSFLPKSLAEAMATSERESPNLVSAMYREQAARHEIGKIRGELLPEVRLEASYGNRHNGSQTVDQQETTSVTGRVSIPLYEGGETYARVRQSKHTHVARLQEIEQARAETLANVTQAWSRYTSARAQLKSDMVQVDANRAVVDGVREEEKAGQRTILDLLNAEQELLDAEVQVLVTRRDLVVMGYTLIGQTGRLTAVDLGLVDSAYDANAHYEEVRAKWFGLDITRADGRVEQLDVAVESDPEWLIDE